MHAAVVEDFQAGPKYKEIIAPKVSNSGELRLAVLATALHPRVRSQANNSHYSSQAKLPLIPGIDGVGRDEKGELRYFILDDSQYGSMAEQVVVDSNRTVVLDEDMDVSLVAAGLNPLMSAWLALNNRINFSVKGSNVIVLGATGSAGSMAIQLASALGAKEVIAVGRDQDKLKKLIPLGATSLVDLSNLSAARETIVTGDIVLDYLWGEPAEKLMVEMITYLPDNAKNITWIEIGSVAGQTARIPSAALRASKLAIVGSGQGSIGAKVILKELPRIVDYLQKGNLKVPYKELPLSEVEKAWEDMGDYRIVFKP